MSGGDTLLRWIPLLPLAVAVAHGLCIGVVRRVPPRWAVWGLSCGSAGLSLALSLGAFARLVALPEGQRTLADTAYTWIGAGIGRSRLAVDLGFQLDPLSATLLLLLGGIATLVHVYAIAYMQEDPHDERGYQRFYCYLGLLQGFMSLLLLADNLVLLLVGWEGVALASYLLTGFWYSDDRNVRAGGWLFVAGRVGDVGFLIGAFLLFCAFLDAGLPASLLFQDLVAHHDALAQRTLPLAFGPLGGSLSWLDAVAWCFLLAVCAKLAQLPLSFWVADSGLAPPPAAALIHGAALAAAGVHLVCRLALVFVSAPLVLAWMAWIGAVGGVLAALLAAAQPDMRRVLVLLAMSQQGLLFLALGCGDFAAALFHLLAHAFVVTLLFLGVGSVSRALHHEFSLEHAGDLGRRLPRTCWSFRVGVAVLAGAPLGSLFFSRGAILVAIFGSELPGRDALLGMALAAVALVAFAGSRLYFLIFGGASRVAFERHQRIRESPAPMLWPLFVIAGFAALGGAFGTPQVVGDAMPWEVESAHSLANLLGSTLPARPRVPVESVQLALLLVSAVAGAAGFGLALLVYHARPELAPRIAQSIPSLRALLREGLYLDAACERFVARPAYWLAQCVLDRGLERRVLDGWLVEGTAGLIRAGARDGLRRLQTGLAHGYLFLMIVGTAAIVGYLLR